MRTDAAAPAPRWNAIGSGLLEQLVLDEGEREAVLRVAAALERIAVGIG